MKYRSVVPTVLLREIGGWLRSGSTQTEPRGLDSSSFPNLLQDLRKEMETCGL